MGLTSKLAGAAGVMMIVAAGATPAAAQGACPAGCDGATNWSGFWLGASIGVNADMIGHDYVEIDTIPGTVIATGSDDTRGAAGLFGSIGLGYDWQIRDRFVLGAFTDFDFGNAEHTESDTYPYQDAGLVDRYVTAGWNIERNSTWTIGTRIGLVTSNTSMIYGLIGYSRTSLDIEVFRSTDDPADGIGNYSVNRSVDYDGLVLGAGLEQDLGNGFSLKGEYRYTNYGSESWGQHQIIDTVNTTDRTETDNFDLDSHSFRLTLAYKFHRGGDVVEEVSYKDVPPAPSYTAPYK